MHQIIASKREKYKKCQVWQNESCEKFGLFTPPFAHLLPLANKTLTAHNRYSSEQMSQLYLEKTHLWDCCAFH